MINLIVDGDVAEISLARPEKLNAMNTAALLDFRRALEAAEASEVRALILRGEGRAFCVGRDISEVNPSEDDVEGFLQGHVAPVMQALSHFPAPTFAVAHGHCLGVGLGLLIASDIVYVADSARIGSPFVNLGATLDSGGHSLLVERLGPHRALDIIITGQIITGREAVEAGLFSRVLPDSEVLDFTRATAKVAATGPTEAFRRSKSLVRSIRDQHLGLWESMERESAAQNALSSTSDYREGFDAFQNKRTPRFTGKQ